MTKSTDIKFQQDSQETFEASFKRLEEILERMNAQETSLEDSVRLFEEANQLIISCHKKLTQAENRIEILLKNRSQELSIGPDGKPQTAPLSL